MEESTHKFSTSPIFAIAVAIVIALMMSAVSLLMYYRSDTKKVVDQIQANSATTSNVDVEGSELTESFIEVVKTEITRDITQHDNSADYNPNAVNDETLGL